MMLSDYGADAPNPTYAPDHGQREISIVGYVFAIACFFYFRYHRLNLKAKQSETKLHFGFYDSLTTTGVQICCKDRPPG